MSEERVKAKFLSKKERQALALQRLTAKREDQEKKLAEVRLANDNFVNGMEAFHGGATSSSSRSTVGSSALFASSSNSNSGSSSQGMLQGKQEHGTSMPPTKKARTERASNAPSADWDASEDTFGGESDPLYSDRVQFKALFGRGKMAGQDDDLPGKSAFSSDSAKTAEGKSNGGSKKGIKDGASEAIDSHWSKKKLEDMNERDWRIFREDFDIRVSGHGGIRNMINPLRNWIEGGFPEGVMKAIENLGYKNPSPIQRQAIPALHNAKHDIIGIAETGSGKTAAFLVPLLCHMSKMNSSVLSKCSEEGPVGLVIAPTRELAIQIEVDCRSLSRFTDFRSTCIVGGESIDDQIATLRGDSIHIVVGTPGRLADCVDNSYMVLNQCQYVVLDEADKMVDMGFEAALTAILDAIPGARVNETTDSSRGGGDRVMAMFSATMPPQVERIARTYLLKPLTIRIGDVVSMKNTRIKQVVRYLQEGQKKLAAVELLRRLRDTEKCIVFVNAKKQVDVVGKVLESNRLRVATLHGGKSQDQRNDALNAFRDNAVRVLVATDVAGRGLDISDVTHVLNYECPLKLEAYTHRIGRTGRAGRSGEATTFVSDADKPIFADLAGYILDCDPKASLPQQVSAARKSADAPMKMN